jgi:hypothetical protein
MSEIELKAFFEVTYQAIYILEREVGSIKAELGAITRHPYADDIETIRKATFLEILKESRENAITELFVKISRARTNHSLENQINQA